MEQIWLLVSNANGYTDLDGNFFPANSAVRRIIYDGQAPYTPPPGLLLVPDDGRQVVTPTPPVATTISALGFINRLTPSEQLAIAQADPLWGIKTAAAGTIDVTDPTLLATVAQAVAGGLLTQARATQILNLAVASP